MRKEKRNLSEWWKIERGPHLHYRDLRSENPKKFRVQILPISDPQREREREREREKIEKRSYVGEIVKYKRKREKKN